MDIGKMKELKLNAAKIRRHVIESIAAANSGHPGGSLSSTDIITMLFFDEMKIDVKNPDWADRDRFVLSKGHAAPAYYAALAMKGFFPEEDLITLRKTDSYLEGHPSMRKVPGCDMSTGSLGQGISCAVGMALAGKVDKKDYRVFSILGDGELEEGQVWEAAMAAAHYSLDNLVAFVDHNNLQIDGNIANVMNPNPVADKFAAFGWNVISIDGHDLEQIKNALESAKTVKGKPTMVVCETVKGKGVSFMENDYGWHGVAPNAEQTEKSLAEINAYIKGLEA